MIKISKPSNKELELLALQRGRDFQAFTIILHAAKNRGLINDEQFMYLIEQLKEKL